MWSAKAFESGVTILFHYFRKDRDNDDYSTVDMYKSYTDCLSFVFSISCKVSQTETNDIFTSTKEFDFNKQHLFLL